MIDDYAVPWLVAVGMCLVFAVLALRADRNRVLWSLAGLILGLSTTTIMLGLSQAACTPISHEAAANLQTKSVLGALLLNLVLGWLFTASLHRQHHMLWLWLERIFSRQTKSR